MHIITPSKEVSPADAQTQMIESSRLPSVLKIAAVGLSKKRTYLALFYQLQHKHLLRQLLLFDGQSIEFMDFITILGLFAGTLTTTAFLPQLFKTWQSKSAKDFSLGMLVTFSIGVFLWLVYGIYLQALPIILANLLTLIFNLIILGLKIRYK